MTQAPLTDSHYREIQKALGHVSATKEILSKAARAGLDMAEPLAMLDAQQAILENLKREYFPTKP